MGIHRQRVQLGMDGVVSVSYCHIMLCNTTTPQKIYMYITINIDFIPRSASFGYSGLGSADHGRICSCIFFQLWVSSMALVTLARFTCMSEVFLLPADLEQVPLI